MDAIHAGGLGGTYGGNPVACASALAAIETMKADDLRGRARAIEALFVPRLQALAEKYGVIGDVRGRGAMLAVELVSDLDTKTPDADFTGRINSTATARGWSPLTCGTFGNVFRFLPPLSAGDELLSRASTSSRRPSPLRSEALPTPSPQGR